MTSNECAFLNKLLPPRAQSRLYSTFICRKLEVSCRSENADAVMPITPHTAGHVDAGKHCR